MTVPGQVVVSEQEAVTPEEECLAFELAADPIGTARLVSELRQRAERAEALMMQMVEWHYPAVVSPRESRRG